MFTHQSRQKLKILREHALIESAISSNRIEGVNVDQSRINTLILGKPFLKDRDEEEVRGYREFEDRVDQLKSPRGAKTELVDAAVKAFSGTFTLHELERACMGVSRDMVRKVLRDLQKSGFVECLGRGPGAIWQKKGNTLKKGNKKEGIESVVLWRGLQWIAIFPKRTILKS